MNTTDGKTLAKQFIELHLNMAKWGKAYIEQKQASCEGAFACKMPTVRQLQMLGMIQNGMNTVSLLSERLGLSKSSISLTLSKMVKNGYIVKEQPGQGDDGRKAYLHLTELGQELSTENFVVKTMADYFDSLGMDTCNTISMHIREINRLVQRRII